MSRKQYDNSKHKRLIAMLTAAGASTLWFDRRIRELVTDDDDRVEYDSLLSRAAPIVPDAFRIDEEELEVIAYEVEVTHPVPERKIWTYAQLWAALDSIGWELRLELVGRFNNRHEVDLFDVYFPAKLVTA